MVRIKVKIPAPVVTKLEADNPTQEITVHTGPKGRDGEDADITPEEEARIAADETLQQNIDDEADTRAQADETLQAAVEDEAAARAAADSTITSALDAHTEDTDNPHHVTLEQARSEDNFFSGEVDMNSNRLRNLPTPTHSDEAVNKSYVDGLIDTTIKQPDAWTPNGSYPTTYFGASIKKGHSFRMSAAGTLGTKTVEPEDLLIALANTPGQTESNWQIIDSNKDQASESVKGVAKIASQSDVQDENTSNNTDIVTPQKWWFGWLRVLALAWTWAAKQTFTSAPRFNSAGAGSYLKTDANKDLTSSSSIPAADVSEDSTHKFVTASQLTVLGNTSGTNSGDETAQRIGTLINGATGKATPVDADYFGFMDSAASNVLKKISWAEIKGILNTLYQAVGSYITSSDARLTDARYTKLFSQSVSAYTCPNDGVTNIAVSVLIPAGTLAVGDRVMFRTRTTSTGVQVKTVRHYFNTSNGTSGAAQPNTQLNTTAATILTGIDVVVKSSTNFDILGQSGAGAGFPIQTVVLVNKSGGSWSISNDLYLLMSLTKGTAPYTDTWTMDDYYVEIKKAA